MMWGGGCGGMWLFGLLTLVGLALLVVLAVRVLTGGVQTASKRDTVARPERSPARQILDERYARGEVTTDQYQERLRTLGEG